MSEILVQRRVPPGRIPSAASLRLWATKALGDVAGDLTIRIVDEAEMQTLNQRYRGKDKSTNVLSFGYDGEGLDIPILGDVVVCASVVEREATEQGKSLRGHWAHMIVHGCLHLLGYDHENDRDADRMESREKEMLADLGFADPYRIEAAGGALNVDE